MVVLGGVAVYFKRGSPVDMFTDLEQLGFGV